MKQVTIIIRPERYGQTKTALEQEGFGALSMLNVLGRGKNPVVCSAGDGSRIEDGEGSHRFMTKKMIMVYINDEDEKRFCEAVIKVNQTGQPGDGKIIVSPVKRSIRVRTGEENENALV